MHSINLDRSQVYHAFEKALKAVKWKHIMSELSDGKVDSDMA